MDHLPENLKGVFPFRLGTTSFIIPDEILPNVEFLSGYVDDVELLVMESDFISPLPDTFQIDRLKNIAQNHNLSYTVHLPLDIELGSDNSIASRESAQKIVRVIERFDALKPTAYVLHLPMENANSTDNLSAWAGNCRRSMEEILSSSKIEPRNICVENLDYPISFVSSMIEELDLSVCFDVGHLLKADGNVMKFWNDWKARIKVIHLHGVNKDGRDHCDISEINECVLREILGKLVADQHIKRVLTLEVFNMANLKKSFSKISKMRQSICTEQ